MVRNAEESPGRTRRLPQWRNAGSDHFVTVTAKAASNVSRRPQIDRRKHDTTQRPPLEMWEEEREHLIPLPEHPYDTAEVLDRTVGPEWHIPYKQNFYSVSYLRIGQTLPVRITDKELIVYSPELREIARHQLAPPGSNQKLTKPEHQPGRDDKQRQELVAACFAEPDGPAFFEELVRTRR